MILKLWVPLMRKMCRPIRRHKHSRRPREPKAFWVVLSTIILKNSPMVDWMSCNSFPSLWPFMYKDYLLKLSNCSFTQDTSKEKLFDLMNETKTRKSNDDNSEKAYFQDDELLKRFRTTNRHATGNIMKKRQNIIGRCFRRPPPYSSTLIVAPIPVAARHSINTLYTYNHDSVDGIGSR